MAIDKTNLSTVVSNYRTTYQSGEGHTGLMSKLNISGQLYDIKDPAVEELASKIQARLNALETSTIREAALEKSLEAPKFATSVTQGTDGQITVTYSDAETVDIKRTATAAVAGQAAEYYTAEDEEVIAGTKNVGDIKTNAIDPQIALTGTTTEAALIEIAKVIAAEQIARANGNAALIGTSQDAASANTIYAAKKYADEAVANLAGTNWETNAKKVQEIIAELENADNANAWATAIDKLAGLGVKTPAVYYQEGDPEVVAGTAQIGDVRTPAVYNTVKDYVDAAILASGFDVSTLNATVRGNLDANDDVTTGHKVGVKVIEQNGVITSVTVVEDDIASAADLEALIDTVEEHSEVTAAALVDLDSRLTTLNNSVSAIDVTTKANKAAISTASVNNWSATYDSLTEGVTWTNTPATVYVPVSGQTL